MRHAALERSTKLLVCVDRVGEAKQEEVDQAWNVSLAALGLDDLDQLVVSCWVELNQNLADDADAWLLAVVDHGQAVKQLNGTLALLVEFLARNSVDLGTCIGHELVIQLICGTLNGLVGTNAIQQLHNQVAVQERVNCLDKQIGLEQLESWVVLVKAGSSRDGNDRNLWMTCVFERLTNQCNIVGCTAATAGLRNQNRGLGQIILARKHCLHNLARDQDRWVADVVIDVAKAHVNGALVNRRQQHNVVARTLQQLLYQLKVDRRHLWSQDGVARFLHLLGVADLLVSCGFCLAVHRCTARRTSAPGLFQGAIGHANALWYGLGNQAGS